MDLLPVPCNIPSSFKLCFWLWCSLYTILVLSCMKNPACKTTVGAAAAAAAAVPSPSGNNETDRLSLLAFKDTINVDPTGALRSWNESLHYCQWAGVACGRRHPDRVITLNLSSLGLSGHIPPSMANLTFLRALNLRGNQLYGTIPPQLGSLSRLRYLSLRDNTLGGEIPSNLSRCSELKILGLAYNQLVGEIPAALGGLPKLRFLNVGSNRLTGAIPSSLGNLSSDLLQVLELRDNALTGGIPRELGNLKGLQRLLLNINKLSGAIPPSLYNLSNIEWFQLARNRLSGTLPPDLGTTLPKLTDLVMGGMQLEGNIPTSLSNASSLQTIELSGNMFRGTIPHNFGMLEGLENFIVDDNKLEARELGDWMFLTSLTNCTQLRVVCIAFNELRGELPNSIANLSVELENICMGANQISGSIPSGIGNLVGLSRLGMGQNQFTGRIPSTMGKLKKLEGLELGPNRLSGEIPTELGNLTLLSELFLDHNDLSGRVPTSIGRLQRLQKLYISHNGLTASAPEELFTLPTLVELDLSNNDLEGPLPSKIGSMRSLRILKLSANRLSGYLPATLGDCQSMEQLYLFSNSLEGTIPPSVKNLKGTEVIDLSLNNLSGSVPKFLEDLIFLRYLNLSFNNFIGEVPRGGVFANASAISLLGNQKLCGGISRLQLPPCPFHEEKGRKGAHSTKIIVATVVPGLCILFFVICFISSLRRMKKSKAKVSLTSSFTSKLRKISYDDLFKATEGFSPNNLVGMGSFGSVYRGILDGARAVAIKVMNFQTQGALKSFRAECEALRSIRHRNLVKIISVCSSIDFSGQEFKALVYEFLPNGSLEKWLLPEEEAERRTLDFAQRLSIAADVASALDYLHNHSHSPIVHCDLKPSNVLLDHNMTAHVGDFGLARFIPRPSSQNSEDHSSTIGIMGTIGYVAPEYGLGNAVSTCGDVYSFGILLLELFTGKRPVDGMFKDGLILQKYVEMALPEQVMDIVDPHLFPTNVATESLLYTPQDNTVFSGMQECLVSLMKIALDCTRELPGERMTMGDVVKEIHLIQKYYLDIIRSSAVSQ